MSSLNVRAIGLFLVLLVVAGCNANSKTAGKSSDDGEGGGSSKSRKTAIPVKLNVKELPGNWVVLITTQQTDFFRWVLKFTQGADGQITAEVIDAAKDQPGPQHPKVVETKVDGDHVQIVFQGGDEKFNFDGVLQQGFIRGTVMTSPFEIYLSRMLPTDESTLAPFGTTQLPPGSDVFQNLVKDPNLNPEDLLTAVRDNLTSPLTQDMCSMLLTPPAQASFDEAKVKEIIETFLKAARLWGPRWEARMEMSVAAGLIKAKKFVALAIPHLDACEQKLGEEATVFKPMLSDYRIAAETALRVQDLSNPSTPDDKKQAAYQALEQALDKQQFNPEILMALATEDERLGKIDTAILHLSDVVAIPMLEGMVLSQRKEQPPVTATPSEQLKKLWKEKHGSDEGYDAHLKAVYEQRIGELVKQIREAGAAVPDLKEGNKTILVEMFTGMICPPCVGADIALNAISRTFPTDKVIVIRYHQHIPGPDGLVNQDSEERAAFYELPGTPLICVDGNLVDSRYYAGPMSVAGNAYAVIRRVIDRRIPNKTEVSLKLSAHVEDGQLNISAEATGIPDDILPSCRLRLAIVENHVETYAEMMSNGIRDRENVVREMPGRPKGIPPKNGVLKFSETMPVAELQKHVVDFITRFEAGRRGEFPPGLKPPIRGPLSLVGWVQNSTPDEQTKFKVILQSAIVPITGDTGFGPAVSAEVAAETSSATSEPAVPEVPASKPESTPTPTAPAETVAESAESTTPPPPAFPE